MPRIQVVTDSACDLPEAVVEARGIEVVPLTIRFGSEEFVDRKDLTPTEFWRRSASSETIPETAAPAPGAFVEAYRRAKDNGAEAVVCVALSSKVSATYASATTAAELVADEIPVSVVDSRLLTIAEGILALSAVDLVDQGASVEEIVAELDRIKARTHMIGALDTLENLRKGGRIGSGAATLGSLLSIKPIIEIVDGEVTAESRQRTRQRALDHLLDHLRKLPAVEHLAVMHADAPDLGEFLERLGKIHPLQDVIITDIGAVIGAHAGPRTIGLAYQVPASSG
jgi:DegV family protein with EDD domain